jgi:hypothetical protein
MEEPMDKIEKVDIDELFKSSNPVSLLRGGSLKAHLPEKYQFKRTARTDCVRFYDNQDDALHFVDMADSCHNHPPYEADVIWSGSLGGQTEMVTYRMQDAFGYARRTVRRRQPTGTIVDERPIKQASGGSVLQYMKYVEYQGLYGVQNTTNKTALVRWYDKSSADNYQYDYIILRPFKTVFLLNSPVGIGLADEEPD